MANISTSLKNWSSTEGSNQPDGTDSATIAGDMRAMQAALRLAIASQDTIASAATTDLGSKDAGSLTITGTTTITSLGTVSAGIFKRCVFSGALTLTHNATSLILPGGANITTAAGDVFWFESLGSGNWRCLGYLPSTGTVVTSSNTVTLSNKTFSSPTLTGAVTVSGVLTYSGGLLQITGLYSVDYYGLNLGPGLTRQIRKHRTTGTIEITNEANTVTTHEFGDDGSILVRQPAGIGYGTGAGGTVTQTTSKSTAVTLNRPTGQIVTHNASLAAGATVEFVLNNSVIGSGDLIVVANPSSANYMVRASRGSAGSATIYLKNDSGGALAEAVTIAFAVIKSTTS